MGLRTFFRAFFSPTETKLSMVSKYHVLHHHSSVFKQRIPFPHDEDYDFQL